MARTEGTEDAEIVFSCVPMNDCGCEMCCGSHRGHRGRREIAFSFVPMNDGECELWCGSRGDAEGTVIYTEFY